MSFMFFNMCLQSVLLNLYVLDINISPNSGSVIELMHLLSTKMKRLGRGGNEKVEKNQIFKFSLLIHFSLSTMLSIDTNWLSKMGQKTKTHIDIGKVYLGAFILLTNMIWYMLCARHYYKPFTNIKWLFIKNIR